MLILLLLLLYILIVYFILRIFKFAAKNDTVNLPYRQEHNL